MKKAFIVIITILCTLTSTLSFAVSTDKDEAMLLDTLIGRPAGLVATVVGTAVFVVGLPFSLLGGNTGDTARNLVVNPARFTFGRPVGDFGPDRDGY
jgi:hypothetical protein